MSAPARQARSGLRLRQDRAGRGSLLSREEAQALADRGAEAERRRRRRASPSSSACGGNTRFADASITTSGGVDDTSVTVTATVGRRRASATTNVLDDASLKRTVDLAAPLARLSPEDPGADAGARAADLRRRVVRSSSAPRISIPRRAPPPSSAPSTRPTPAGKPAGADLHRRIPRGQRQRRSPWRRATGCSPITAPPMPTSR